MQRLVVGSCQESEEPSCVVKLFEALSMVVGVGCTWANAVSAIASMTVVTIAIKITTARIRPGPMSSPPNPNVAP